MVITAAHVVGHWPFFTHPHVLIAGHDLPAKVIKLGSFERIDLALLSVEADRLPISLQMRRNSLCHDNPKLGTEVVDVVPGETARFQIISPKLIAPELRGRFNTLIGAAQASGSGLFDAERKCLLGTMSAKVPKQKFQNEERTDCWDGGWFCRIFCTSNRNCQFHAARFSLLILINIRHACHHPPMPSSRR
jgi:hypothetical protein